MYHFDTQKTGILSDFRGRNFLPRFSPDSLAPGVVEGIFGTHKHMTGYHDIFGSVDGRRKHLTAKDLNTDNRDNRLFTAYTYTYTHDSLNFSFSHFFFPYRMYIVFTPVIMVIYIL